MHRVSLLKMLSLLSKVMLRAATDTLPNDEVRNPRRGVVAPKRRAFTRVLHLELLALRHQLQVLQRSRPRRVHLVASDCWLWTWMSRVWTDRRTALVIVKPETVIAWHRRGFRLFWTWRSRY
jgi:hypothetical protein